MNDFQTLCLLTSLIALGQSSHPCIPRWIAPLVAVLFGALFGMLGAGTITLFAALHGIFLGIAGLGFVTLGDHVGTALGKAYWKARDAQGQAPPPPEDATASGAKDEKGAAPGARKA